MKPAPVLPGLYPYCDVCGWRKGGRDSWNGTACKCGHVARPLPIDHEARGDLAHVLGDDVAESYHDTQVDNG